MKKAFLESWTGGKNSFGESERFTRAIGSSLEDGERVAVNNGGVAFHEKGTRDTKVFLKDENQNMYSVTVKNFRLAELKQKLQEVGYHLPDA